jgi:hypothetical protein
MGTVLNNLMQSELISKDYYDRIKFINSNRNNFAHNYFMRFPKALKGKEEMKLLIVQIFYTVLSLNQLIIEVYSSFKNNVIEKNPVMLDFLHDFNELFIGEFKG